MAFSSLVLRQFAVDAERIGIASRPLYQGIVEPADLARDHIWIPDRDMFEIVARALRTSGTSDLGLKLGVGGSFTAIGASGLLISVAASFRQALRALAHFERVARDTHSLSLKEEAGTVSLEFGGLDGPIEFQRCMTECIASNLAGLLHRFAGPAARFERVLFNYPAPAHEATYGAVFGCEMEFDAAHFEIVVDAALADRVQLASQPQLAETLWRLSEEQLLRFPRSRTIVDDVRDGLRVDWGARPPPISALARRMGLSERSLRRRLAEMRVDYRSLVAERQQEIASQMLRRHGISVKEVAHGLGYGSASAFHRAFKRWTGASTKEHRAAEH